MIQLTKDLWMKADEYQYIVGKPVKSRGNGTELRNPRYYPTVAQAVSATLEITLRKGVADGSITPLREFIREQERQRTALAELVAPLAPGGETTP